MKKCFLSAKYNSINMSSAMQQAAEKLLKLPGSEKSRIMLEALANGGQNWSIKDIKTISMERNQEKLKNWVKIYQESHNISILKGLCHNYSLSKDSARIIAEAAISSGYDVSLALTLSVLNNCQLEDWLALMEKYPQYGQYKTTVKRCSMELMTYLQTNKNQPLSAVKTCIDRATALDSDAFSKQTDMGYSPFKYANSKKVGFDVAEEHFLYLLSKVEANSKIILLTLWKNLADKHLDLIQDMYSAHKAQKQDIVEQRERSFSQNYLTTNSLKSLALQDFSTELKYTALGSYKSIELKNILYLIDDETFLKCFFLISMQTNITTMKLLINRIKALDAKSANLHKDHLEGFLIKLTCNLNKDYAKKKSFLPLIKELVLLYREYLKDDSLWRRMQLSDARLESLAISKADEDFYSFLTEQELLNLGASFLTDSYTPLNKTSLVPLNTLWAKIPKLYSSWCSDVNTAYAERIGVWIRSQFAKNFTTQEEWEMALSLGMTFEKTVPELITMVQKLVKKTHE